MANIAEGFNRGRRAEFHQFASVTNGSCVRVPTPLHVALGAGYLAEEEFLTPKAAAEETIRTVAGLRTAVGRQRTQPRPRIRSTDPGPSL